MTTHEFIEPLYLSRKTARKAWKKRGAPRCAHAGRRWITALFGNGLSKGWCNGCGARLTINTDEDMWYFTRTEWR